MTKQAFNMESYTSERTKEEKNSIIQNTIFGQLLSITHNMLAFEVDKKIIHELVIKFEKSIDIEMIEQIKSHVDNYEYAYSNDKKQTLSKVDNCTEKIEDLSQKISNEDSKNIFALNEGFVVVDKKSNSTIEFTEISNKSEEKENR